VDALLPLFPLTGVLFPDEAMALRAIGDRHRPLVHSVMDAPEPARVGVIAIREGREDDDLALHDVGCIARVRRVVDCGDGRFVLVATGTQRFRVTRLDRSEPCLRGELEPLAEETGDEGAAQLAALAVRRAFASYVSEMAGPGGTPVDAPALPADPVELSYLVAALMMADVPVKQSLLAEPDALARLSAERRMLSWEVAVRRRLGSIPMPDMLHSSHSRN
jgi:hypothetical protein